MEQMNLDPSAIKTEEGKKEELKEEGELGSAHKLKEEEKKQH